MTQKTMKHILQNNKIPSVNLWDQWLAGLIDGDGCFLISKAGQISLEITVAAEDERMLQQVKQHIGGILKPRSGSRSVRLRVFKRDLLIDLVHRVNGHIRLASHYNKFKTVCDKLEIKHIKPAPLLMPNGYVAGLFDADGSVTISVRKTNNVLSIQPGLYGKYLRLVNAGGYHQLSLHIVAKDPIILEQVHQSMGFGSICSEGPGNNKPNRLYRWYFRNYLDVERWLNYIQKVPLRSQKYHRCFLLRDYFELKRQKVHLVDKLAPNGNKQWLHFCQRWFKIVTLV